MSYIDTYYSQLLRQKEKIPQMSLNEYMRKKTEIKRLIKERWLIGKRPDGSLIAKYSQFGYATEKYKQNSKAGFMNVDLIDTGSLVNQITTALTGNGIEIISTDKKFNAIADKYGDDNFNISDEQQEQIENDIAVIVIDKIMNNLWR